VIKSAIKQQLRSVVKTLMGYPLFRRLGQRLLAPFPRLRGRVIRLVQASHYGGLVASNRTEGYGERQQRLMNGLEQRWKQPPYE